MGTGWSQDEDLQPTEEQIKVWPSIPPQNNVRESGATRISTDMNLPHNYEEILKVADASVDKSSTKKLYDQLCTGVFLNQNKKKYWVDWNSKKNSFMLYARDLSITWAKNKSYWHWPLIKESSDASFAAAELLNVCWPEVHGRFTVNLTPRTTYEVTFVVMLKDPAYGWDLPDGSRQEHKENMMEKTRGKWIEVPAGEFETLPENGDLEFSLYEYEGGMWKKRLVIKGIVIRPKD